MQSSRVLLRLAALAFLAITPMSTLAQDHEYDGWNHFGLNFRSAFNIRARFSEPSSLAFRALPSAGGAVNRQYNDGFVGVDSSGNSGNQTWNWGYQNASQISGNNILMHSSGTAGGSASTTDDPNLGLDFNYVRDIGHYAWGEFGMKIAFGYTHAQLRDQDPIAGNLVAITDRYPLNGVVPPLAPYSGSASGPGPVIGSQPSRTTSIVPDGSLVIGSHNIDAALYDLRLGPSFDIPLFKRFSIQTGGGLALGVLDSRFTFSDISPVVASGGNRRTGIVPGAYAEAGFAYRITHSTSVFTGAQFQYLGHFQQNADGRSAALHFGDTVFFELGLQWQF